MANWLRRLAAFSAGPAAGFLSVGGSGLRSAFSKLTGTDIGRSLISRFTGNALTGAEREANEFSASQAQLQRDFQEQMYNQYESPAAKMRQYQEAGLNPALMYGSAPSGDMAASVSPASSVSPSGGLDPIAGILQLMRAKAEIKNIEADTRQKNAGSAGQETTNEYLARQLQIGIQNGELQSEQLRLGLDKVLAETESLRADTVRTLRDSDLIDSKLTTERLNQGLLALDNVLKRKQSEQLDWQNLKSEWEAQYRKDFGVSPDLPMWNALPTLILSCLSRGRDWLKSLKDSGIILGSGQEALFAEYGNPRK